MAPLLAMHEFYKLIGQNDFNVHFTDVVKTHTDRVNTQQLKMIHQKSGIHCTLCFAPEEPSLLIMDILSTNSLCKFHFALRKIIEMHSACYSFPFWFSVDLRAVAYIKAWQMVLNEQKKEQLFQFNTYTIVVMMIAVLQRQFGFPTIDEYLKLRQDKQAPQKNAACDFDNLLKGFFSIFGVKYQRNTRMISLFVLRFVNTSKDDTQKIVPPAEQM